MSGAGGDRLFLFDTTSHAMWAEETAVEKRVPVEVVPAPREAKAKCGVAIRTLPDRIEEMEKLFQDEGIPYRLHP